MSSLEDAASSLASLGRAASRAIAGALGTRAPAGVAGAPALPAGSPQELPYLATLIVADLGASPDALGPRAVSRILRGLPVPAGHRVLWADVELGTRSHGLVVTDRGLFLKDGPPDDDDDEETAAGAPPGVRDAALSEDGLEVEGLGYRYLPWDGFDPARVSHAGGWPTLDGAPFTDGPRFRRLAAACVRISNRRARAVRDGRQFALRAGCLGPDAPVRPVYRATPAATASFCFDSAGEYKFYARARGRVETDLVDVVDPEGARLVPVAVEVPADQFDAVLRRMRSRIEEGAVPGVEDLRAAGALVRRGRLAFSQARSVAAAGLAAGVRVSERTGSVLYAPPAGSAPSRPATSGGPGSPDVAEGSVRGGLTAVLDEALGARSRALAPAAQACSQLAQAAPRLVGELLAHGEEQARGETSGERARAARGAAHAAVGQVASSAGYAVGATGARVLLSAAGLAAGPLSLVAGMALGDVTARAGTQAFSMARDLVVEPRHRVLWRLMWGVADSLAADAGLVGEERVLLRALLARGASRDEGAAALVGLGARLHRSADQEEELRAFLAPLVEAARGIR